MKNHSKLIVCAFVCASAAYAADVPRLAVFAGDATVESRNMADLVQAELSSHADVEMVERAEIDRVLREQELTAAGLTDVATRVQLGRLLKAKGLVFVGARTTRVVETSDGFLAGSLTHPQNDTATRAATKLSADVVGLLPKLTRNPELHTCVTILRFNTAMIGTAGAHENEATFDTMMLDRLTAALCAEPDVLVMERRRTGDLLDEASLAGERLRLKSGTLIVDGELASALMEATDEAKPSVALTVRVRALTDRAIEPVVVRGFRAELDKLAGEAVLQTVETVRRHLRVGSQDTLKAEVETLLFLARENRAFWASEAAYALDPTNAKARDELIKQLYSGASGSPLARYYGYARMEQIFREAKMSFPGYMSLDPFSNQMISDLSAEESHADPELVALLRPLRQAMEREIEKNYSMKVPPNRKGVMLARMVTWATALAGTNRERYAIRKKIFERTATDPGIDEETRDMALGYMLTQHNWRRDFLDEQTRSDNPVRRYYAHCRIMWGEKNKETRSFHANAAAREVDDLLKRRGAFGKAYGPVYRLSYVDPESLQATEHWLIFLIRRIYTILPEIKEPLTRKVFERAKVLLAEKDYYAIQQLEPHITFLDIPEKEFLAWIDEMLNEQPPWNAKHMFSLLEKCAADIRPRVAPEAPKASNLEREVLFTLSDFERKWKRPDLLWRWKGDDDCERSDLLPGRLLLDGGTLWVALGSGLERKQKPCGLVAIDTATGKIISGRLGVYECHNDNLTRDPSFGQTTVTRHTQTGPSYETHYYPILPLARSGDFILFPYGGEVGVGMFPVQASGASDLRGVEWVDVNTMPLSKPTASKLITFVCAGDTCYLGLDQQFILSWKPPAKTTTVILNTNQKMTDLQLPDLRNTVEDMWFDPKTEKLIAFGRQWEVAGGGYRSRNGATFAISFNPKTSEWALLGTTAERPDVASPAQAMRKALEKDADEFIADVAPIDANSCYALVGYGTRWRLEKVKVKNDK